jgi:hypothetical protein
MELFVQGSATGSAQFGDEALSIASDHLLGRQIILLQAVAPVQRADNHYSGAECPTHLLLASPHATGEASGHPHQARVELAQDVPAHGEHDRLRSVIALPQQTTGLRGYLLPRDCLSSEFSPHRLGASFHG